MHGTRPFKWVPCPEFLQPWELTLSNLCFRNFQIEKVSKKHQKLRGTPSFAEHAAAYKDEIIAQENIRKKVDLINLSHNWEISSVFIGLEAVDFKANLVSCFLAVMISFRQELKKVIHLCRGGLLWYTLLPFFYCLLTQQNSEEHTDQKKTWIIKLSKDWKEKIENDPIKSSSHWCFPSFNRDY